MPTITKKRREEAAILDGQLYRVRGISMDEVERQVLPRLSKRAYSFFMKGYAPKKEAANA